MSVLKVEPGGIAMRLTRSNSGVERSDIKARSESLSAAGEQIGIERRRGRGGENRPVANVHHHDAPPDKKGSELCVGKMF